MKEHLGDGLAATAKSSLAAAVVGATIFGYTIQEAAAILGGLLILMQMAHLAWKWRHEYLAKKAFAKGLAEPLEPPK